MNDRPTASAWPIVVLVAIIAFTVLVILRGWPWA